MVENLKKGFARRSPILLFLAHRDQIAWSSRYPISTTFCLKVCRREFIPPHIVAEAISTLRGLDLRWSGPITPGERRYVEQYVLAKYPQYSHGLIGDDASASASDSDVVVEQQRRLQTSSSSARGAPAAAARLEPSRLLDMLARKASFPGSFVSIPEIQARNRVLRRCGLADDDDDYLVLFAPTPRDVLVLVGESYPFFRGNYYMSILAGGEADGGNCVRAFAAYKDAKVIAAPESWLDLRIKGSQLSQYFRRKCKHAPKGLFRLPRRRLRPRRRLGGGGGGEVLAALGVGGAPERGGTCCWTPRGSPPGTGCRCRCTGRTS
ncbi:hypothetical protein OsJ_33918 [Oryza sativa Japonica Group]|uniref:Uncharacterized protein n=1 Tax=Oryza sativa subsp. japonica TaxID=39947 RepID=B9GAR1_ORYSJ|nr:hypothetical protein OsJ_33918 [Oryza sativa Japonica Group]